MEEIKDNLSNYLFLNSNSGLIDERAKLYESKLPKVYGEAGKLMYVAFNKPILLDPNFEEFVVPGTLIHTINGKLFVAKDNHGYYLIDNLGNISKKHYDKVQVLSSNLVILSNCNFKNERLDFTYTVITENGIIWEDEKLPDTLFYESGYYILKDKVNTSKFQDLNLEVLYNSLGNAITATINNDLIEYYETIKEEVIPKPNLLDARDVLEGYTKKQLRDLKLGNNTDRLVDMIINANCQKILLVIDLENGKVKTFKNSELKELEEANARHLARLRGNK